MTRKPLRPLSALVKSVWRELTAATIVDPEGDRTADWFDCLWALVAINDRSDSNGERE